MHSLLEGAKAVAVVKYSWQSLGLGDTLGLGFWLYTRKQGAGFLRRSSKLLFSCSFCGCDWAELGAFVTILQVLMIPNPHLPLLGGAQIGKNAGWSSPELVLEFPGGLQQGVTSEWGVLTFLFLFPWREEVLFFPAGKKLKVLCESAAVNRTCQGWWYRHFPPLGEWGRCWLKGALCGSH